MPTLPRALSSRLALVFALAGPAAACGSDEPVVFDAPIVLTDGVSDVSFERALEQLHGLRSKVLLVLQPVTPRGGVRETPDADLLAPSVLAYVHDHGLYRDPLAGGGR